MPSKVDTIQLDFIAAPRLGLVTWPVRGESVIIDPETRQTTVLNGFASMIWSCLDGCVALSELVPDVAYAFNLSPDVVAEYVLDFGRAIARAGLLANFEATVGPDRPGLVSGDTLVPFEWQGVDGVRGRFVDGHGWMTLLVNWNPSCGFCVTLASELAVLSNDLKDAGVNLVLLTSAGYGESVESCKMDDLDATVALRPDKGSDFKDPFPDMGTPVAYLVDDKGVVQGQLAVGAVEVAQLARRAAGRRDQVNMGAPSTPAADLAPGGPRTLSRPPPSSGLCGPTKGSRRQTWEAGATYEVGGFRVGVQADSVATDRLLGLAFAAYRVTPHEKPAPHLSVVLGLDEVRGTRPFNLLLIGNETVIRSRSPRRVVRGLAAYLSALVAEEETTGHEGTLAVSALPAIFGSAAVLLPLSLRSVLAAAEPRLARAGFRLVDVPRALIDLASGDLVVPRPTVEIDETAFEALAEPAIGPSEGAWVPPGRYPVAAWALGSPPQGAEDFTMATAVASAWSACFHPPEPIPATLAQLQRFFEEVPALPVTGVNLGEIVDNVRQRVTNRCGSASPTADWVSVGSQ